MCLNYVLSWKKPTCLIIVTGVKQDTNIKGPVKVLWLEMLLAFFLLSAKLAALSPLHTARARLKPSFSRGYLRAVCKCCHKNTTDFDLCHCFSRETPNMQHFTLPMVGSVWPFMTQTCTVLAYVINRGVINLHTT